ncbi:cation-transporting P-type ATPase [Legionella taurinensis]|uniref:Cation-transporting P-type ATPase n=1 Tax=Legionella taurinensis TaxID=70611 RepID=A0AB38NA41_9GAMM|nr:cation-translocating P-type ATPase [Legionella taurinensis]MDX1836393.1 cation-translocating P-type ATPase [Legionella taurinensis]PUT43135.1 heavy metal translocating P-type ATPase [Legionella taurinensis]PUT45048.1 heavy metal translocating P-type ATPase [Legionella taurinensis]PUT45690.1 heavy metal translocating P-type ATPase [Legionella taurinensis]PUT49459.1 heavy metal translocating P-type ATPase [Legionella taurinensis]
MTVTYHFSLPGITCGACVNSVQGLLEGEKARLKLLSWGVDLGTKRGFVSVLQEQDDSTTRKELITLLDVYDITGISVEHHPDPQSPVIEKNPQDILLQPSSSYGVSQAEDLAPELLPPPSLPLYKRVLKWHWLWGVIGTVCGIALMIACMVTGGLPLAVMIALGVTSVVLTLILGASSYYQAAMKLVKARTLTMDTLFAISTLTIIGVSIASFFVPWLPMMFEAGLLIFGFRHIGLAIEESIKDKLGLDRTYQSDLPQRVRVLKEGKEESVDLSQVAVDDILVIQPGEIIPLDGLCLSDDNWIDDNIISGAIMPRRLRKGEHLLSGMRLPLNASPLVLQVKAVKKESYLACLDERIAKAYMEKAPIEEMATNILQYFIPAVIGLALLSGIIIACFFPPALAIQCAVTVLVSACPCTLGLVVPLALMIGNRKAADHGVQFKSGKALQAAAGIDAVVLDLNGTLTLGEPKVTRTGLLDDEITTADLYSLSAALENHSTHAFARAICDDAQEKYGEKIPHNLVKQVDDSYHAGLKGEIAGTEYLIGNQELMEQEGVKFAPDLVQKIPLQAGDSLVFLATRKKILGYFVLTDPLRSDAKLTIDALKAAGKTLFINTGASFETARRYAERLGIPEQNIQAGCVGGEEKALFIQSLKKKKYKVAMVGDGGNDGLPLACSDMGFAVQSRSGHQMASQNAGAIIQKGALLPIAHGLAIARQAVSNIKQNLGFSLAYNMAAVILTGGLLVALGITLNPAVGVALMILQTLLILGNAYRFKLQQSDAAPKGVDKADFGPCSYTQCQSNLPLKPGAHLDDPGVDLDTDPLPVGENQDLILESQSQFALTGSH